MKSSDVGWLVVIVGLLWWTRQGGGFGADFRIGTYRGGAYRGTISGTDTVTRGGGGVDISLQLGGGSGGDCGCGG